jgi:type II secretory pathway pseudopilin PulG
MTILAVILSFAAPSVMRSLEQSHADLAGASLRMINTAQRFYWLENRTYAANLQTLIDDGLLDGNIAADGPRYEFSIVAADANGFQATARRRIFNDVGTPIYNGSWEGAFTIDETGAISGTVDRNGSSTQLTPAF